MIIGAARQENEINEADGRFPTAFLPNLWRCLLQQSLEFEVWAGHR
jgi:hypothetical protein